MNYKKLRALSVLLCVWLMSGAALAQTVKLPANFSRNINGEYDKMSKDDKSELGMTKAQYL